MMMMMMMIVLVVSPWTVRDGKKVNFTLEQVTKAQRASRGIALLFL